LKRIKAKGKRLRLRLKMEVKLTPFNESKKERDRVLKFEL
jgi:hypothetical protein